jgi:hypothetical protein
MRKVTGSGSIFDLTFTYDAAERLTDVTDGIGRAVKHFAFATANGTTPIDYRNGKLQTAVRHNRVNGTDIRVSETYAYGATGQPTKRTTLVENYNEGAQSATTIQTFAQEFGYDQSANRNSITYPTVASATGTSPIAVLSNRWARGFLVAVNGYAGDDSQTDGLTYHPNGMVATVNHGSNGSSSVLDRYDIDSATAMARPSSITFSGYTTCTPPDVPTITAASASCPSGSGTAWTAATAASYAWTIQNGTITSGAATPTVTYTAGASGVVTLTLVVGNSCATASASKTISILSGPTATVTGSATISSGASTTIQAALTGQQPWSLTWSDNISQTVQTSPAQRSVSPSCTTNYTVTAISDATCTGTSSGTAVITVTPVLPGTPANLVAIASAGAAFTVSLSWSAGSGADSYEIIRTPGFASAVTTTAISFTDTNVVAGATYLYKVRAVRTSACSTQYSAFSNLDPATTIAFTPITVNPPTAVAASHFMELRNAVNAMRAVAGLQPATWNASFGSGLNFLIVHISELRNALDPARAQIGLPPIPYGETIGSSTTVKKSHLDEIRGGVQ